MNDMKTLLKDLTYEELKHGFRLIDRQRFHILKDLTYEELKPAWTWKDQYRNHRYKKDLTYEELKLHRRDRLGMDLRERPYL